MQVMEVILVIIVCYIIGCNVFYALDTEYENDFDKAAAKFIFRLLFGWYPITKSVIRGIKKLIKEELNDRE